MYASYISMCVMLYRHLTMAVVWAGGSGWRGGGDGRVGGAGGFIHGDVDMTHRAYDACAIVLHVQCCVHANGNEHDAVSASDDYTVPH